MNSEALTKIQSLILIAVIVVAAIGGVVAYILLSGEEQSSETIKIGVCADLDTQAGVGVWQGAVLAAEQINAEGGVLGRNFEIVAQDDDTFKGGDMTIASNALTKLITVDKADFIISACGAGYSAVYQEIVSEHQKILFHWGDASDALTQKVLDDYDRYKYYFRTGILNETTSTKIAVESIVTCREYTGFNKVAILSHDLGIGEGTFSGIVTPLNEFGFDVVHTALIPMDSYDFSSYFARAEAAGAEILFPLIFGEQVGILFVKEYYDRQSPMVMWNLPGVGADFWEVTEGKCDDITCIGHAFAAGYPLTSKVVPTREAYFERWGGDYIDVLVAFAYDVVRFILPDAIERAGTIETDAVITALEETEIETSLARKFAFTSSHDTLVTETGDDYFVYLMVQWQDGEMVPVYPIEIMEEAGATYTYPDWPGPWD